MDGWSWLYPCCLAGALIAIGFHLFVECSQYREGYREGQIDAANGVIKYELQEQDDGTTSWGAVDE